MFYFAFKEDFCYNLFEVSNTTLKMVFLTGKKKKKDFKNPAPYRLCQRSLPKSITFLGISHNYTN